MHFKKIYLRGEGFQKKESNDADCYTTVSGINVNHSLTDQLTKLNNVKTDHVWNEDLTSNGNFIGSCSTSRNSDIVSNKNSSNDSFLDICSNTDLKENQSNVKCKNDNYKTDDKNKSEKKIDVNNSNCVASEVNTNLSTSVPHSSDQVNNSNFKQSSKANDITLKNHNAHSTSPTMYNGKKDNVKIYKDPDLVKQDESKPFKQIPANSSGPSRTLPSNSNSNSTSFIQASLPAGHSRSPHTPNALSPQMYNKTSVMNINSHIDPALLHSSIPALHGLTYSTPLLPAGSPYAAIATQMQTAQLIDLWQSKYPSMPVPPSWMLSQYQDELLRGREIIEQDRLERSRLERDRMIRERSEREAVERERRESERLERERVDRETLERERQEKEKRSADSKKKIASQSRVVIKESAEATVDQHFSESLRLASQKAAASGQWNISKQVPLNLSIDTVRPPPAHHSNTYNHRSAYTLSQQHRRDVIDEHKDPKVSESLHKIRGADYRGSTSPLHSNINDKRLSIQQEHMLRQEQQKQQLKENLENRLSHDTKSYNESSKIEKQISSRPAHQNFPSYCKASAISQSQLHVNSVPSQGLIKQEPNFNLYGYQPFQHTYISHDLLYSNAYKEGRVKEEKPSVTSNNYLPNSKHSVSPTIKETIKSSGVCDSKKETILPLSHQGLPISLMQPSHQGSITLGTAVSPRPNAKPPSAGSSPCNNSPKAESTESPLTITNNTHNLHNNAHIAALTSQQRTLSPFSKLHSVTSPQLTQSAIIPPVTSNCTHAVITNPLQQQHTVNHRAVHNSLWTNPMPSSMIDVKSPHMMSSLVSPISSSSGQKRTSPTEVASQISSMGKFKKLRPETQNSDHLINNVVAHSPTPFTSPISTLTVTSQHDCISTHASYLDCKTTSCVSIVSHANLSSTPSSSHHCASNSPKSPVPVSHNSTAVSSDKDTFRSFVEKTVSHAYYMDPDLSSRPPKGRIKTESRINTPLQNLPHISPSNSSNESPSKSDSPHSANCACASCCSNYSCSTSSIVESINRVGHSILESDNDILNIRSPLHEHRSDTASPPKTTNHTKFKKAWLQRYSGEDQQNKETSSQCGPIPFDKDNELSIKHDNLENDISRTNLKNKDPESDLISSSSEAETQEGIKKRRKSPKESNKKKSKLEDDDLTRKKRFMRKVKDTSKDKIMETDDESFREKKEAEQQKRLIQKGRDNSRSVTKVLSDSEVKLDKKRMRRNQKDKNDDKNHSDVEKSKNDKNIIKKEGDKKDDNRTQSPSLTLANKPLNSTSIENRKKSMDPFLQDDACSEVTPKLMKCRECKMTPSQKTKEKMPNIFCRFYAFRRLKYNVKGALGISGFSEPADADADDIELWMPRFADNAQIDVEMAKYLISNISDQFCELVEQEKEAMNLVGSNTQIAWKRAVQGVREMCDVCNTTLFNMHWVCHRCGFVVCIDCYRLRTSNGGSCHYSKCITCEEDGRAWLKCIINRQTHEPDKLMLTQIIPSDALWAVGRMVHEVKEKWQIKATCPCIKTKANPLISPKHGVRQLLSAVSKAIEDEKKMDGNGDGCIKSEIDGNENGLSLLADVASMDSINHIERKNTLAQVKEALQETLASSFDIEDDCKKDTHSCSTLKDLITKTAGLSKLSHNSWKEKSFHSTLDDIIQQVAERNNLKDDDKKNKTLKYYVPRLGSSMLGRHEPITKYTLTETSVLFPDVPHSWLDNGKVLRLHDPIHKGNLKLFQQQWRRCQPVLVSNCNRSLTKDLWAPATFTKEFGEIENDLVNCRTGIIIVGHKMKDFWDGFDSVQKRLRDEKNRPMILKLKDWPSTEDFSDTHPGRFQDLLNALPLPDYTHRTGVYNLASRLPDFFVRPDLGPKMYNAYASSLYPKEGTTNLHLDISDATNLMAYIAFPTDDAFDHREAALHAINEAGVCLIDQQRLSDENCCPGALWHIFDAHDADKIRDLLNKTAQDRGEDIECHHDPIHDQSWYLDADLRKQLKEEYDVEGYTLVQCLGDAIFIPAGAPHQVRNLNSCIKIAEDFVSPENLNFCFKLTQEFRHLSDTHSNHEDKLQVKNMIYHALKEAVAVLQDNDP